MPHWGDSNEYPHYMILWEYPQQHDFMENYRKVSLNYHQMPSLSVPLWHHSFCLAMLNTSHQTNEPPHDKTNKMTVHPLRSAWASAQYDQWVAQDPSFLHADSEDWSDWADAQADLSLHCAHMPFCSICHEAAEIIMQEKYTPQP